ncbi:MAG: N-acetylmuramoyl-L-alanine amidase [Chitinophagaceae bacterium]|nr:N-acetylmuramoyl-L-alanine amidase [Chitinophagaceae bacterium]
MRILFFLAALLFFVSTTAQQVFLKLVSPNKNEQKVTASRQFITGTTCKECTLTANDSAVKVWPTGAFAVQLNLKTGDSSIKLIATDAKGFKSTQTVFYSYQVAAKEKEVTTNTVEYWRIEPQGDLLLKPGDILKMTLKTVPGSVVKLENGFELKEVPVKDSTGVKGIYKAEYVIKSGDDLLNGSARKLKAAITTAANDVIEATSRYSFGLMPEPIMLQTKGKLPYLLIGLGEDRLGGTKMGYLDSMVKLKAVSKVADKYCVQLSKYRTAYIEEQHVDLVNNGSFTPASLTNSMRVWGDSLYDYVSLILYERLPYQSFQQINPSTIIADVFGATANTNWITQMQSVKEIKNVICEQTEDEVLRIKIELNHQQHWGHSIYYAGNNLIIRVKRQPKSLLLKDLVIGVDAGHGGDNKGAFGITGIMEKDMTLLIAKELKTVLEAEGATVIIDRTKDTSFDNHDRYTFFKEKNPDLLISIHLNSSADPIRIKGVSTYYKHIGYRSFTQSILKEMLGMGLGEFGNVGNFNFILNGFTEFPNVLVETLFISHPEDETNVLNAEYRKQMALRITQGIKNWLQKID